MAAATKSAGKTAGRPFAKGSDARRGKGPAKGAANAGAPKRALRVRMRESLDTRLSIAESIADDSKATAGDRMRALDFLAKYGLGARNTTQRHELTGKKGAPIEVQQQTIDWGTLKLVVA